jgi:DNA-binding CsgD family transcriptional regulator
MSTTPHEDGQAARPTPSRSLGPNAWQDSYMSTAEAVSSCAGFALGALYLLVLLFGNAAGLEGSGLVLLRVAVGLAAGVTLVVLAFVRPERQAGLAKIPTASSLSALLAAATALLALARTADGWAAAAVTLVAGAAVGVVGALTLVQKGCYFTRLYIPDAITCTVTGALVALLAYVFLFAHLTAPWGLAAAVLLPLANIAVYRVIATELPGGLDFGCWDTFRSRASEWPLFLYKVAVPFLCLGCVAAVLLARLHDTTIASLAPSALVGLVVACVTMYAVVTFGIAGLRRRTQSYSRLVAMLLPLIALAAIPLYSMGEGESAPLNLSALSTVCLLLALGWAFLCSASLEYLLSPVAVYALGLGSLSVGGLLGGILVPLFADAGDWLFPVLCLACLVMCLGLVPANPAKNLSRSSYTASRPDDACCAEDDGMPGGAAVADDELAEKPLQEGADSPAERDREHERGKGRFVRRCEYAAQLYQLSPREFDVLVLLAKGRSMSYVQEALVVSEGTAKTHIRHIYRKMNVHSRHELVELIESIDLE